MTVEMIVTQCQMEEQMLEWRSNFVLSIITILMVIDHCISMKPMIALQFPLWLLNPQSNPILAPKKGMRGPKKRLSQIHIGMDFLQKKHVHIGQFWPLWPNLRFTEAI